MNETDSLGRKKSGAGPFVPIPTSGLPDDLVPRGAAAEVLGRHAQTVTLQANRYESTDGKYGLRFYRIGLHRMYSMADLVSFAIHVYYVGRPGDYLKYIKSRSLSTKNSAMAQAAYEKVVGK